MTDLNRIKALAGLTNTNNAVENLKLSKQAINESMDLAIKQTGAGVQITEGLFTSLVAALSTAGQATLLGSKAIADKAKKLAEPIKQLYLDAKSKAELKELFSATEEIVKQFDGIEKDAKTLLTRDKEIKSIVDGFKAQLANFIGIISARASATQASESLQPITDTNVSELLEGFMAGFNKEKWVNEHLKDFDLVKHRALIMHVLASKLSFSELKALKTESEKA